MFDTNDLYKSKIMSVFAMKNQVAMSSIQEADPYFLYNSYKDIRGSFIDGPRDKELQVQILQLKAYNN